MGFIREDKTNGNNNDNNVIKTISSKVLATVPASDIKIDESITVSNVSINGDRRYYIEFLGSKKLCSVMVNKVMSGIMCSMNGYVIQALNHSTDLTLNVINTNADDTPISTDLVIYEEEIKCLDNKYIENDLIIQNSISLGRIGDIGISSVAIGSGVNASGSGSHAEGTNTTASAECSHAEGMNTEASGTKSHAEGSSTQATGNYGSHAEGSDTTASGTASHAEGNCTTASAYYSHAEGDSTTASGDGSHAEGNYTTASAYYSHAEGSGTTASGDYSHAEGSGTTASGDYSHAEGSGTTASSQNQHVQGKYNIEDTNNKYAHIVGNGEDGKNSNAHTLDWEGNAWFAGKLSQEGTPTENKDLVTKKYLDDKINNTLVTTNISGTTLSLTTDKYQTATIVNGTEITLPAVTSFTKIHLFFSTTADLTLTLPTCKWQNGNIPTISANKTYEFIFTYTTEWLGVVIVYG